MEIATVAGQRHSPQGLTSRVTMDLAAGLTMPVAAAAAVLGLAVSMSADVRC